MAVQELPMPSAPTREVGSPIAVPTWANLGRDAFGIGTNAASLDREYVPELRWPISVRITYPAMGTDSQLDALMRGTILPVSRYTWALDRNGARPELVDAISAEFNLPLAGAQPGPLGRAKRRFSFAKHRDEALDTALRNGHAYYQQVGDVVPLSEGGDGLWHLRKLSPRPPWTLSEIRVADDGGLLYLKQQAGPDAPQIPVDWLVGYVWNPEPGSWLGRSMFRSCYREWLIKDRLLRVDANNHEKGGGVWYGEAHKDATPAEKERLSEIAGQMNSLAHGRVAVSSGDRLHLERPGGSNTAIDSVNRHDEAMARAFLLMLIQLGQTQSGSRAVGDSFNDLFAAAQQSIATWFRDVFNEHVIEDWVDWNYGPAEEFVPRVVFEPGQAAPTDALDQAAEESPTLAAALAKVKQELEQPARPWHVVPRPSRAATAALPLPDRPLRREPTDVEVRAQVDFEQLDRGWQAQVDALVAQWQQIRAEQIEELEQLITSAGGDLEALAEIRATAAGGDLIATRLKTMAALGVGEAVAEAVRQGAPAATPSLADLEAELEARAGALEGLLAQALSQAASVKAVQLSGGELAAEEVAGQVRAHLEGLSDVYLSDQFGGALSAAQNRGRMLAMAHNQASRYYASELLDLNTCQPCLDEDGREFDDAADAATAYPAGGYRGCLGGPRCRGTVVATYEEASSSAQAAHAAKDEEPGWVAKRLAPLEQAVARLLGRSEQPLQPEVHVHQAAAEPMRLEIAEGAIQTHVAPAHVDVHLPAQPRPRAATARRRDDGSLEVTYDEGGDA